MQELDVMKMRSSEKLDQVCKEVDEAESANLSETQLSQPQLSGIKKYLEVEDRYFSSVLSNHFKRRYLLQRNINVGGHEYDGIAISLTDTVDIIYEIKYWKHYPSTSMLLETLQRLYDAGMNYGNLKHRNYRCILAIVTTQESIEKTRSFVGRILSEHRSDAFMNIEVQFVSEEEILR